MGYQRPQLRVVNTLVPERADGEGDVLETYVRFAGQRRDSRPDFEPVLFTVRNDERERAKRFARREVDWRGSCQRSHVNMRYREMGDRGVPDW